MRVGLFLSDFPIYYLPWACEIVDGLAARGLEIDLYLQNAGEKAPVLRNNINMINLSNPGLRCSQEELDYVARQNIPFSHLLSPASIGLTQIISEKKKYDYCIGLESKGLLLAKIAADASGCRLGYLSFELYEEKNPGVWGDEIHDVKKFESLLMPEIDLFMIQDETRHNEYFKILNTNRRPQNTMYFPVSLPRVCLSEKPRYWHERYNLPEEFKIVFYIGQITSNRLLDKMVMGAQSFDDDQLLVVHGPAFGNINDILRQLKQLDKKNKVIFSTDEVDCNEMKYLVASADIGLAFYSTDRINDFTTGKSSAKLARYMQAGIPVICPEYPTFKDVVDKYHNGEYFSDFAKLPQLVNRIFDNYSYYCKGAKQAFGYIYNLDKYLNVLSKHIKNGNCSNISGTLSVDTTWEQVRRMPVIRLYAGDVPKQKEYEGVIGLSLSKNDQNHLQHDITQPFPLIDNTVDSFQTEDVFEHIPFEKLAPVVNEIYRVLKPGGLFRLSVPDYGCDVLQNRSIKDEKGQIVFDRGGGGTPENPGHVWFPRIDTVMQLLTKTKFHESGKIELLHYYNKDGTFVAKPIDYSKGHVMRTPDFDERVKAPYRPMSLVIDLTKGREMVPQNSVKPVPTQLYKNSQNREEFLPLMTVKNDKKSHYGKEYFDWQKNIGSFGGLANLFKFKEFINITDTVIDFGCGGGYLLRNLQCKEKMGIEVNPHARQEAKRNGIQVVESADEVPDKFADIIISNHALEHVGNPLEVLKKLRKKLKNNGKIIFVVPHQDTREEYDSADKNKHLYTWNQMTLGNLFSEAGYEVLKAKAFQHQWPPNYIEVCSQYGEEEFHKRCREYAIKNDNYQIRIVATQNSRIRNYVMKDIPVILVCYNRPWHTLQVLKALEKHNIQNLYIFSDAPKTEKDQDSVAKIRKLIKSIYWTKPEIIYQEVNQGLAKSIVGAANYVFQRHDRLILLEDDCVPKKYYFDFIRRCLSKYEDNTKIFGINGYSVPIPDDLLANHPFDIYFYPRIGSWGWATWKRAWKYYDLDLTKLYKQAITSNIDINQGGPDIHDMVQRFIAGKLKDVWTLNWILAVYLNNGYYIYPTASQIQNIGCDGTGLHSDASNHFDNFCDDKEIKRLPDNVIVNQDLVDNYNSFFGQHKSKLKVPDIQDARHSNVLKINNTQHSRNIHVNRDKLSIVHINTHDIAGGAAKVAWRLAEAQRNAGLDSRMLVGIKESDSEHSSAFPIECDPARQSYCKEHGQLFYDCQGSHKLIANPIVKSADIVHMHNLHGGYFNPFSLSAISYLKPLVWTLHDMQSITGHCAHSFDCQRWQTGCGRCPYLNVEPAIQLDTSAQLLRDKKLIYDHSRLWLVTPSQWLKSKIERSVLQSHPVELIYNSIDTTVFKPCDRVEARKKFGVPAKALVIGAVAHGGALTNQWKGGKYTQKALEALKNKLPDHVFVNIGGDYETDNPKIINIPHINNESELARAYSTLDIFLNTSVADNCPLVILEALSCGIPIVTFDTGGIPELVCDGQQGCVTTRGDQQKLVQALQRLAVSPDLQRHYGHNARERAVSRFDCKIIYSQYENLYERILEESKAGRSQVKLFPSSEIPKIIMSRAFIESENSKLNAITPKAKPATPDADSSQTEYDVSIVLCTKDRAQLLDQMLGSLKEGADDFDDFTYSKKSHFALFKGYDVELYGKSIDPDACDLKAYQDLLVFSFIKENIPRGSRILDIGGGKSRILNYFKNNYECWNLDKLEGLGNGPVAVGSEGCRLVKDYIGCFNKELPDNYFDFVFSISALEHVPEDDEGYFKNIRDDIDRILKPGGYSLHCFDVVMKQDSVWTNKLLPFLFTNLETAHPFILLEELDKDSDLYCMSKQAYSRYWEHTTKRPYEEFGKPLSYNIMWRKALKFTPILGKNKQEDKHSLPKISVITPSYNQAEFLEECIDSILSQNYPNLEYIIMDGASTDGSAEIIRKYEKYLTYWQSKPDAGQYAAINEGLQMATGQIMTWLNSDDKHHKDSLFKAAYIFEKYPDLEWMTGRPTAWNDKGELILVFNYLPLWSREKYLQRFFKKICIQQESTFWKRSLWEKAGARLRTDLQFAGDLELWVRFFRHAQLFTVDTLLGGYRYQPNQKTNLYLDKYMQEGDRIIDREIADIKRNELTRMLPAPRPISFDRKEFQGYKKNFSFKVNDAHLVGTGNEPEAVLDVQAPLRRTAQDIRCRGDFKIGENTPLTIATSIAPKELEKQIKAIESWIRIGFDVVSINCREEIGILQESFPDVKFVQARRDARKTLGKPFVYLDDFLKYFQESDSEFCSIVNSDIRLVGDEGIISFIKEQAKDSIVYGSRIDVDSSEALNGRAYNKGFDFFFFHKSLISSLPKSDFCIGAPWWDYLVPLVPILKGIPVKKLVSPFAYHIKHPHTYSPKQWLSLGEKFFEYLYKKVYGNIDSRSVRNCRLFWQTLFSNYPRPHLADETKVIEDEGEQAGKLCTNRANYILEFLSTKSLPISYLNGSRKACILNQKAEDLSIKDDFDCTPNIAAKAPEDGEISRASTKLDDKKEKGFSIGSKEISYPTFAQIQQRLDKLEYCQKFVLDKNEIVRPIPGGQTDVKLKQMGECFPASFHGKRFLEVGANKGFFTMLAAKRGASEAIALEPMSEYVELMEDIKRYFKLENFKPVGESFDESIKKYGLFDIVFVGSVYHYIFLSLRDHAKFFSILSDITSDYVIFEGPTSLDDAYLRRHCEENGQLEFMTKNFTPDAIFSAAKKYFGEIEYISKWMPARGIYVFKKKKHTYRTVELLHKNTTPGHTSEAFLALDGNRNQVCLKKSCTPQCFTAIPRFFGTGIKSHPLLVELHDCWITDGIVYQVMEYLEGYEVLGDRFWQLERITKAVLISRILRMELELLRHDLLFCDLSPANFMAKGDKFKIIDLEGLVYTNEKSKNAELITAFGALTLTELILRSFFDSKLTRNTLMDLFGLDTAFSYVVKESSLKKGLNILCDNYSGIQPFISDIEKIFLDWKYLHQPQLYRSLLDNIKSLIKPAGMVESRTDRAVRNHDREYLVSAVISTYNSEKFLRGCLNDLEQQTIADKLEIIVVNSNSEENEEAIVHEYQQKYNNIVYIETEQREGIYTAWNRAVKVARGTFLTNANTDDRHREDALEIMSETLLTNPDVALVYGDQICTDTPNGTFANHHAIEMARRAEYSHERLLFGCCVGSQPMWRKSLHAELGYFDDTLTCAGDWDFWLRISISSRYKFKHIPEFLGLYYYNENGIEHGRKIHSLYERYIVGKRYGNPYISVIPLYTSKDNPLVSVIMPAYNAADYIAEAIESVLIQNYRNFELIVIDDGSTDNTKDIVTNFKDEKIKYFYKNNGGPSGARNLAINKSKGQYIMPLDADDMMTPDFIVKHLAEFEKYPDADLVYCDVLLIDGNSNPIRIMNKPEYQDRRHLIRDLFRAGHPIIPFRFGIKRSVFDKIGFYDEDLLIGEDYDMMRRFVKAGLKAHHLSEPLHLRRIYADSLSGNQSAQKAKSHFEVIKRFIDTFAYDELFPDVAWDEIAPQMRQLHAKCLAAGTYLTIGQNYVRTKAIECSRIAFDLACSELNDCVKMDQENQGLRQLLQKSKLIRAKYTEAPQQVVS